jgi:hypothetical protein
MNDVQPAARGPDRDRDEHPRETEARVDQQLAMWHENLSLSLEAEEVEFPSAGVRYPAWLFWLGGNAMVRRTSCECLPQKLISLARVADTRLSAEASEEMTAQRIAQVLEWASIATKALDARLQSFGRPKSAANDAQREAGAILAIMDVLDLLLLAACEHDIRSVAAEAPYNRDAGGPLAVERISATLLSLARMASDVAPIRAWFDAQHAMLDPLLFESARSALRATRPFVGLPEASPARRARSEIALGFAAAPAALHAAIELEIELEIEMESEQARGEAVAALRLVLPGVEVDAEQLDGAAAPFLRSLRGRNSDAPALAEWPTQPISVGTAAVFWMARASRQPLAAAASASVDRPSPRFRWIEPGGAGSAAWVLPQRLGEQQAMLRFFESGNLSKRWTGKTVEWLDARAEIAGDAAAIDAFELGGRSRLDAIVRNAEVLVVDGRRWILANEQE